MTGLLGMIWKIKFWNMKKIGKEKDKCDNNNNNNNKDIGHD